jgi:single-strand DNA-binding protein
VAQSLNLVQIIGNLGRDAEMRYTVGGQPVTNFSVATSRSYKKNDEWIEETEWVNVTVWGDKAERAAEYLRRGNKVYVQGRLKTTKKEIEGQPGKHSYYTEVVADQFIPLTPKAEAGYGGQEQYTAPAAGFGAPEPTRAAPASAAPEGEFRAPAAGFNAQPTAAPAARPTARPPYEDLDDLPF